MPPMQDGLSPELVRPSGAPMSSTEAHAGSFAEIFAAFLRLGLTAFGGPVAHLAYFRSEFVGRRRWLDEASYASLVALCQCLPGPASSQVGAGVGLQRGGVPGAAAAWLGFTLPSAVAMTLVGLGLTRFGSVVPPGSLQGLKLVAVAVVAQAVWAMAANLCPDWPRRLVAVASAAVALFVPGLPGQLSVLAGGAVVGRWRGQAQEAGAARSGRSRGPITATALLLYALGLLFAFTSGDQTGPAGLLFSRFYRVGALAFGGGHVVLPLLQAEVVAPGLISNDLFLTGYGLVQAVPGPLFTLAAYLGAVAPTPLASWLGAVVALVAIFLPGLLLVILVLPHWERWRRIRSVQAALQGVNAAVVGLLLVALANAARVIVKPLDLVLVVLAWWLLKRWPPWLVVLAGAGAGTLAW